MLLYNCFPEFASTNCEQKDINETILDRYYKFQDELKKGKEKKKQKSSSRESSEEPPKRKLSPALKSPTPDEDQDRLLALKLQRQEARGGRPSRSTRSAASHKVTKLSKTVKRKNPRRSVLKTPFNAPFTLSTQLLELLGVKECSRPQVVKQLWIYIKKHGLQDQADKRNINCDSKMRAVFRKNKIDMFEMNKLLGRHLYKEDEILAADLHLGSSTEDEGHRSEGDEVSAVKKELNREVKSEPLPVAEEPAPVKDADEAKDVKDADDLQQQYSP